MDETASYTCPRCGERVTIALDPSAGREQDYIEDCAVCCHPNSLRIEFDRRGRATVTARPE